MRDYGMMKSTLALLEEVQERLQEKKERAQDEVEQREKEFSQYESYFDEDNTRCWRRTDEDGLITDVSKWDYDYRKEQLKEATDYMTAIENIIKYLDNYKL